MGRRTSLLTLADEPIEKVPGRAAPTLVRVPPEHVTATPLNPRQNFPNEELKELGESMRGGQLQPCVAIARAAYLKLWPEHADQIPDRRFVLANGERRWRAAAHVGLDGLDIVVREDLGESREAFITAVLTENLERKNFDPIEEARGLQSLEEIAGSGAAAARRLNKSKGWFSQRTGLLRLVPEMQQMVSAGVIPIRDARRYSALPKQDQMAVWEDDKAEKAASPAAAAASAPSVAAPAAPAVTRLPTAELPAPEGTEEAKRYTAVYPEEPQPVPATREAQQVPEPRHPPAPVPTAAAADPVVLEPSPALSASMVEAARVLVAADPLAAAKALAQVASSTWLEESSLQMMNIVDDARTTG